MAKAEFREILFALNDMRNGDVADENSYKNGASIFKKAQPAILNYPVITSDLISLEDLTMINKALEREYATVVRLAMGLDDIIDVDDDGDLTNSKIKYIKKFHTNSYNSKDRSYDELLAEANSENLVISEETEINEFNKNELIAESLGLNMNNLNSMTISEDAPNNGRNNNGNNRRNGNGNIEVNINQGTNASINRRYEKQLLDNDVKKANELIPTTLDISVFQKVGERVIENHILLGVKCTSHKVSSELMTENLVNAVEQKRGFFRFIQWTTGEIKFFKDYLLCLDTLKKEALESRNRSGEGIKWFRTLKNQSTIAKLKQRLNLRDQLIPNSTIVVTMDEVDYIRNKYNIDLLKKTGLVEDIMKTYFLIGFVIVDSASEVAYFKFDGFSNYQMFTFRALERENRNVANDVKALTSLMGKF